jgi:quinol monooxygenase YgiN
MITFVTRVRVRPGDAAAFEAVITEMTAKVRENEPGALHYGFGASIDEPNVYVVVEVYADEAAFKAHWETDYIRPSLARTTPLIEAPPEIRQYVSPGTEPVRRG